MNTAAYYTRLLERAESFMRVTHMQGTVRAISSGPISDTKSTVSSDNPPSFKRGLCDRFFVLYLVGVFFNILRVGVEQRKFLRETPMRKKQTKKQNMYYKLSRPQPLPQPPDHSSLVTTLRRLQISVFSSRPVYGLCSLGERLAVFSIAKDLLVLEP